VPDARWIWYNIGYGTTCEIRKGDPLDADTGTIRAQLILPPSIPNIKLKAGDLPWTDNWRIEDLVRVLPYKHAALPLPDLGDGDDESSSTTTPTPNGGGGTEDPPPPNPPPSDSGGFG